MVSFNLIKHVLSIFKTKKTNRETINISLFNKIIFAYNICFLNYLYVMVFSKETFINAHAYLKYKM